MMNRTISLGRAWGVPIEMRLSSSILFILLVMVMAFADEEIFNLPIGFGHLSVPFHTKLALSFLCALVVFLGILVHEMAHCMTAKMMGHEVRSITLLIYGGEANIPEKRTYETMKGKELIAFMGPASNLIIAEVFIILSAFLNGGSIDRTQDILITCFSVLAFYNLIFGIFNLLPGYPFDGGLMLRTFLRRRMDLEKTTMTAVKVCRTSALGIGALGFLGGDITVILIAVLLYAIAYIEDPEFNYRIE